MKKVLFLLLVILVLAVAGVFSWLRFALPSVGPAPDLTVALTTERIERGKYLATHVMVCLDCHTQRDFSRYSGPVMEPHYAGGGEEFTREAGLPGNFYPPNLTPHHLGEWTDGELYRAITSGVNKDGKALFPAMPYHLYGQADDEDIYSVIAYLRTLEPVESELRVSKADFPVSLLINTMPMKGSPTIRPDSDDKVAYGKYMATVAGCIECHTPMKGAKVLWDEAFTGGREFPLPAGIVRTTNLTPDKRTGIGSWTEEMFLERFKTYSDSAALVTVAPDAFNTPMPWSLYSGMEETDLKAIYAYLQSLQPVEKEIVRFSPRQ